MPLTAGRILLVNAGHCLPIVVRAHGVEVIPSTGLPVGLFADRPYDAAHVDLAAGDAPVLYTDGLSEARRAELTEFLGTGSRSDDLTILALRRS